MSRAYVMLIFIFSFLLSGYKYSPADKVDPFTPFPFSKLTNSKEGVASRLLSYETQLLTFKGATIGRDTTALLLTPPPEVGVIIRVGDRVGNSGGRVVLISRGKVIVREPITLQTGSRVKFRDVTLELPYAIVNPGPNQDGFSEDKDTLKVFKNTSESAEPQTIGAPQQDRLGSVFPNIGDMKLPPVEEINTKAGAQ